MPALDAIRDLRNSRSSLRPASREDPSAEPQQQAAKLSKLKALSDADKDVITALQTKIKEQQNELDNRTTTINAIQRNFEQLSTIALAERAERVPQRGRVVRLLAHRGGRAARVVEVAVPVALADGPQRHRLAPR